MAQAQEFSNTTAVDIPDRETIESTIEVSGVDGDDAAELEVDIDLEHSYFGDLDVRLYAPDGTPFTIIVVEDQRTYALDASAVTEVNGTWTLRIEDQLSADEGTLNGWSLHFNTGTQDAIGQAADGAGEFTNGSSADITYDETVESTIDVSGIGTADSVRVYVDISHTYFGDLTMELFAPDGTSFDLDPPDQGDFELDLSSVDVNGTWTLFIEDTHPTDDGTLSYWSLTF